MATDALILNGSDAAYTPPSGTVTLDLHTADGPGLHVALDFTASTGTAPAGDAVVLWFGTHRVVILDGSDAPYYHPTGVVDFGKDYSQPPQKVIPKPQPPPSVIRAWSIRARDVATEHRTLARLRWDQTQHYDRMARLGSRDGARQDRITRLRWDDTQHYDRTSRLGARDGADAADRVTRSRWIDLPHKDGVARVPWGGAATRADRTLRSGWDDPPKKDTADSRFAWTISSRAPKVGGWFAQPLPPMPAGDVVNFVFGDALRRVHLDGSSAAYVAPSAPVLLALDTTPPVIAPTYPPINFSWAPLHKPVGHAVPVDHRYRVRWNQGRRVDDAHLLRWGKGTPTQRDVGSPWHADPPPPDPTIPTIARLGVYVVTNSVSVIRLPDQTPIKVLGVTASLDYTQWAWTVQLTLADASGLTLLTPDSNGPKEVQITINGFTLTAIAESYQRTWSFGKQAWVVSGRSRSAWLAAPYAPTRSLVSTSLSAASQLATAELSGTGFTLDWQAPDWNLDAGQWSYQNLAPVDAISKLAAAVGGTVQPDPVNKSLSVVSRYPVSPSGWASATPDAIVPSSVLTKLGLQWQPAVQYNAAFLTGGSQGVNVNATLANTAGDNPIPSTISDPLLTAVEVGQERARVEIVGGGNKLQVSAEAPIIAPVGVLLPGKLIEVDEAETWRGLVQATSIVAKVSNALDVRQTLTIERRP